MVEVGSGRAEGGNRGVGGVEDVDSEVPLLGGVVGRVEGGDEVEAVRGLVAHVDGETGDLEEVGAERGGRVLGGRALRVQHEGQVGSEELGLALALVVEHGGEAVGGEVVGRGRVASHLDERGVDLGEVELEEALGARVVLANGPVGGEVGSEGLLFGQQRVQSLGALVLEHVLLAMLRDVVERVFGEVDDALHEARVVAAVLAPDVDEVERVRDGLALGDGEGGILRVRAADLVRRHRAQPVA